MTDQVVLTVKPNLPDPVIYLDCDPGIDDAVALALLLRWPSAQLVGVGSVSGNTDAVTAAHNAAGILAVSERTDVPVAIGRMHPLAGGFLGGFPNVHGEGGLGGVAVPATEAKFLDAPAASLLVRLAHEHRGRLRVVAIGPLSNLADALDLEPDLSELVEDVVIMGGAYRVPGNVTPYAEANIWSDPEAADRVLTSGLPITLVPLDVTMRMSSLSSTSKGWRRRRIRCRRCSPRCSASMAPSTWPTTLSWPHRCTTHSPSQSPSRLSRSPKRSSCHCG